MAEDGLKIETAASVTLRDMIRQHMQSFYFVLRANRPSGQAVIAAYVDGLAGAMALTIASGHGSKDDIVNATIKVLREAVDRDLRHLERKR